MLYDTEGDERRATVSAAVVGETVHQTSSFGAGFDGGMSAVEMYLYWGCACVVRGGSCVGGRGVGGIVRMCVS